MNKLDSELGFTLKEVDVFGNIAKKYISPAFNRDDQAVLCTAYLSNVLGQLPYIGMLSTIRVELDPINVRVNIVLFSELTELEEGILLGAYSAFSTQCFRQTAIDDNDCKLKIWSDIRHEINSKKESQAS